MKIVRLVIAQISTLPLFKTIYSSLLYLSLRPTAVWASMWYFIRGFHPWSEVYFWSPFVASIRGPHSWSTLVAPFVASICGPHSWFSTVVLTSIWGWLLKICVYFCFMQSTLKAIDLHFQARIQQNLENGND